MVQVKIADMTILKAWFGSSGEFIKACKKPGLGVSDDPAVLAKCLVSAMWCLILAYAVNIAYWALAGAVVTGVIAFIQFSLNQFLQSWIFWYSFVHRESDPCCPVCIFCLLDFKPMHLIMGILMVLIGVSQVLTYALTIPGMLATITEPTTILYLVFVLLYALYAVCYLCAGLCLVKLGGKKAGVEVPGADKVGAPEEMSCA